jgi:uncharacterized membrane-anchored protein
MTEHAMDHLRNKVPQVTLGFWVIKLLATTLGETGGDALSMSLNLGYLASTFVFLALLVVSLGGQVAAKRFHPALYWLVIVATTLVGTTTSDYLDRTLGLGYTLSSALLLGAVLATLAVWRLTTGSISVSRIDSRVSEAFYWLTILFSNTLGTALGDWLADTQGVGFADGALVFAAALALVAACYYLTRIPHAILFWAAFVLTRPFGATFGDVITKPLDHGGLDLSRLAASGVLALLMVTAIALTERWAGRRGDARPA